MKSNEIMVVLFFLTTVLGLGTLIGAMILRAAVSLYNKMAGPSAAVPGPPLGKAIVIMFVTTLANAGAGFGVGTILGSASTVTAAGEKGINVTAQLISIPLSLLVMAGMVSAILPTTFLRALSVTACYFLVVAAIAVFFIGIIFLVAR